MAVNGDCNLQCALPNCGNGAVDPGEECDDGAGNSDTAPGSCRTTCRAAYCGDFVDDPGEECDWGKFGSDVKPDVCRKDCTNPICGDGVVDVYFQEECDGGPNCNDVCRIVDGGPDDPPGNDPPRGPVPPVDDGGCLSAVPSTLWLSLAVLAVVGRRRRRS